MATMKQCVAAAREKWGRKFSIETGRWVSSPEQRAAAQAAAQACRQQRDQLLEQQKQIGTPEQLQLDLIEAAQFVVDVSGDAPSIPRLAEILKDVARHRQITARCADLQKAQSEHNGAASYFRYKAGTSKSIGGLGVVLRCYLVNVSADTLEELLVKIRGERKEVTT